MISTNDIVHAVISIHAPARGATNTISVISGYCLDFNPRSREGSDSMVLHVGIRMFSISIHAPARGATIHMTFLAPKYRYFNPRSREGSDALLSALLYCFSISIHAPARGATLINSRAYSTPCISIHAPARGATSFISVYPL